MQPSIVKQPIHDSEGKVWANELLYSKGGPVASGASDDHVSDSEAAAALQALFLHCNNDSFLENKPVFVTFTENLLRRGVPRIFSPDSLVLQIDHDFLLLSDAMQLVKEYQAEGYKVALVGFDFNTMYLSALSMVDYVKLSFRNSSPIHKGSTEVIRGFNIPVIAYQVNDAAALKRVHDIGIRYKQGSHIANALPANVKGIDLMASNFFQLIVAITRPEPNFAEIESIISRDVTLTYSILKLVNSAYFALRSRVTSVQQALVVLGISQLKQWIYLLSFKPDGNAPIEFIKTSLMRASFCEALCVAHRKLPISKTEAYLLGLFSTLSALLSMPMEQALAEISLSDVVRKALLTGEGISGTLYKLVLSYERADWNACETYAEELGISMNVVSQKYLESSEEVSHMWQQLTQSVI